MTHLDLGLQEQHRPVGSAIGTVRLPWPGDLNCQVDVLYDLFSVDAG